MSHGYRPLLVSHSRQHWWFAGMRRITRELTGPIQGRVLDVGCGVGWDLADLPPGARGVGVDRHATDVLFRPLVLAEAGCLPFTDAAFDWVLALDLLDQREVRPAEALAEIERVLRPQGRLLVRVPAVPSLMGPHDDAWGGARRFVRSELDGLVRGAGLVPIRLTYANTVLFPAAGATRLLARAGLTGGQDVQSVAEPLNRLMFSVLDTEAHWLRRHDLPFGLSLLCVAVHPEAAP